MSERLSSVEIEDVLSSIRRLVSEDLRPGAKPVEQAPAAAVRAEGPGRLLLTPSLRIAPDPVAEEEETPAGPAPFHSRRGDEVQREPRVGAVLDEVARAVDPATEEDAPPPATVPEWFAEEEVAAAVPVTETEEPAAMLAEVEAPVAEQAARLDVEEVAEAPFVEVDGSAEEVTGAPQPMDDLAFDAGQADRVDPVVFEAEEAPVVDDVRVPPVSGGDAGRSAGWADAAEAEIRRELEEEAGASVFARFDAGDADGQEPLYDEEMLRELVRDIIREELQGALGERITRNVRKLVRAEIARALAVRDFE